MTLRVNKNETVKALLEGYSGALALYGAAGPAAPSIVKELGTSRYDVATFLGAVVLTFSGQDGIDGAMFLAQLFDGYSDIIHEGMPEGGTHADFAHLVLDGTDGIKLWDRAVVDHGAVEPTEGAFDGVSRQGILAFMAVLSYSGYPKGKSWISAARTALGVVS